MYRILPWALALMASLDLIIQTNEVHQNFLAVLDLRRKILKNPWETRREFCQMSPLPPLESLVLLWREGETWVDSCQSMFERANSAPRYWKLEVRPKIRLLFLGELPITLSIVILS